MAVVQAGVNDCISLQNFLEGRLRNGLQIVERPENVDVDCVGHLLGQFELLLLVVQFEFSFHKLHVYFKDLEPKVHSLFFD